MSASAAPLITAQQYLALERVAKDRSEFFAGEIYAMAGASRRHNLLVANLIRLLGNELVDRDCNVYPSDLRVRIEAFDKYTYPDLSVACGEERFEDEQQDVLLNPVVLIEVLSDSTEAYDRGAKFEHYQALDSLREYVLVSQKAPRIEVYTRRDPHQWLYHDHGAGDRIELSAIDCRIDLDAVYHKVDFSGPRRLAASTDS